MKGTKSSAFTNKEYLLHWSNRIVKTKAQKIASQVFYEKTFSLKLSGNAVYYTA